RLKRFFSTNGAAGCWLLTSSLPTFVRLLPDGPVDRSVAARLFELASQALREGDQVPVEPEPEPGGPSAHLARALQAAGGALRRALRRPLSRAEPATQTAPAEPASDVPFPIWLTLASHPDWVARVEASIQASWSDAAAMAD